jgi:glutamine---fructose-6-phosphate transaminase (isomerizing)
MTTLLEQEISSQPSMIAQFLDHELDHIHAIASSLVPFQYIVIAARGSSDHAATYATYAWAALAGYPVVLATPSLHTIYGTVPRFDGALVVGISQSGQSPDIIAVLAEAHRQGRPTVAITNDASSPLADAADHVVQLHVGREQSVAATKTYTAQVAVIAAFAAVWSKDATKLAELRSLPEKLATVLEGTLSIASRAERYRYMDRVVVIGRGYNYATALELALKLKELTYVMATSYSSADFRHGPIATIDNGDPVILIMPDGRVFDDMSVLARDLQQRGAELLVISEMPAAFQLATTSLSLATSIPEWLSPIAAIIPGQIFALHLALAKGLDPDVPRGLNKVTKTV